MFATSVSSHFTKLRAVATTIHNFKRTKSSALYITGDKAHETFAVLTPHLDFDERLQNKNELESNLKLRGLDINLEEIIRVWNFYKHIEAKKSGLEDSKISISQTIKRLSEQGSRYAEKIDTLMAHGKMVKEDLKVLKEEFWSIEEKAAIRVLSLPNILHEKTPESESVVFHTYSEKPNSDSMFHLDVARNLDLVEYHNSSFYFLKNDAAMYELASTFYFTDLLLQKNYSQFSNSDFSRSVIVEGCGTDYSDPKQVFTINEADVEHKHENSRLHLTGGATLTSFMAYFTKHIVFPSLLPLKYFTVGRKYQPTSAENQSLLNVTQETAVDLFVATKDDEKEMNREFEKVLTDVIDVYESLGNHFRICFVPAKHLKGWESLRASVQMFSTHLHDYVEVGNVSLCGNYVSKRLLFNYGKGYDINYPCVITGTIMSVPKILACILESGNFSTSKDLLPEILKKYVSM